MGGRWGAGRGRKGLGKTIGIGRYWSVRRRHGKSVIYLRIYRVIFLALVTVIDSVLHRSIFASRIFFTFKFCKFAIYEICEWEKNKRGKKEPCWIPRSNTCGSTFAPSNSELHCNYISIVLERLQWKYNIKKNGASKQRNRIMARVNNIQWLG